MGVAAELRALNLIAAQLRRREGERNAQAGNGVLRHAHGDNLHGVDHVLGTQINQHRLVFDDVDVAVVKLDVVLAVLVGGVHAEDVALGNELHVLPAEFSVQAGITHVPAELLRHDLDDGGVLGFRKVVHILRPDRYGHADEQHGFNHHDGDFAVFRQHARGAGVVGPVVARGVEPPERVGKIKAPADEQCQHQPVDINHEVVHRVAVGRGELRQTKDFFGKPVIHIF